MGVRQCDVLVVGGGPGGSTVAALLARQGRKVILMEKDVHPRFHIGESLLPANMPLLDELGVRDEVNAIGMPKWGVEFISPNHVHTTDLRFTDAWDQSLAGAGSRKRIPGMPVRRSTDVSGVPSGTTATGRATSRSSGSSTDRAREAPLAALRNWRKRQANIADSPLAADA